MKRLLLFFSSVAALTVIACGGGGAPPAPPPPMGPFSNSSLNGQYAFSMTGSEIASSGLTTSNLFTRAGSFTADGNGHITGGVEDVNLAGGVSNLTITGGSYTVNADGRGTLSLINTTGTLQFSITLASSTNGYIIAVPSDGLSTAGGNFFKQDPAAFALAGIANNYAFDFAGLDVNRTAGESIIGQFFSNGNGVISTGVDDDNDGGNIVNGGNQAITGNYAQDSLNPSDLANFGRGVANIGGIQGVFYIVDQTRFKFIETTSGGAVIGDAVLQSNIPLNVNGISGGFVYVMGGSTNSASSAGPITRGGRFTANGGSLSAIQVDNNNAGQVTSNTPSPGTYTIDSTGTGRGVITFTDSHAGTFTYVFYLISPTQAVVQDQSPAIVEDGSLFAQPASISNSSLAGNYAFNWSGISSTDVTTDEEDFVGQLKLSSGSFTGAFDLNEFASGKQFFDIVTNGNLALTGDGSGHNAFTANLLTNPSNKLTFFAYVGGNNTILLMGTQSVRVISGVLTSQTQ